MKYQEIKEHYRSGHLACHYYEDDSGNRCGEFRRYYENGHLRWQVLYHDDFTLGEVKTIGINGTLRQHYLQNGKGKMLASVIDCGNPNTHSEEQLIQIAKEHGLPLLSDLPKTEAELTHWNLKWPDLPLLPIATE